MTLSHSNSPSFFFLYLVLLSFNRGRTPSDYSSAAVKVVRVCGIQKQENNIGIHKQSCAYPLNHLFFFTFSFFLFSFLFFSFFTQFLSDTSFSLTESPMLIWVVLFHRNNFFNTKLVSFLDQSIVLFVLCLPNSFTFVSQHYSHMIPLSLFFTNSLSLFLNCGKPLLSEGSFGQDGLPTPPPFHAGQSGPYV